MSATDDTTRLLALEDIRRLMHEYAWRFDHGEGVRVAELFTAEGAWRSNTVDAVGRTELEAFFARRDALTTRLTRHVITNIAIDLVDADHAWARSYAVEIRGERGTDGLAADTRPAVVGDYLDEIIRVEGQWLFQERRVALDFKRESETFAQFTAGS